MTSVPIETELKLTDKGMTIEIECEVDYRCFISDRKAIAPMTLSSSVNDSETLQEVIKNGKESYEKDYLKVEVMGVRLGEII